MQFKKFKIQSFHRKNRNSKSPLTTIVSVVLKDRDSNKKSYIHPFPNKKNETIARWTKLTTVVFGFMTSIFTRISPFENLHKNLHLFKKKMAKIARLSLKQKTLLSLRALCGSESDESFKSSVYYKNKAASRTLQYILQRSFKLSLFLIPRAERKYFHFQGVFNTQLDELFSLLAR